MQSSYPLTHGWMEQGGRENTSPGLQGKFAPPDNTQGGLAPRQPASWKGSAQHIENELRRSLRLPGEEGRLGLHLSAGMDDLPELVLHRVDIKGSLYHIPCARRAPGSLRGSSARVQHGAGFGRRPGVTQQPRPVRFHGQKPALLRSPSVI